MRPEKTTSSKFGSTESASLHDVLDRLVKRVPEKDRMDIRAFIAQRHAAGRKNGSLKCIVYVLRRVSERLESPFRSAPAAELTIGVGLARSTCSDSTFEVTVAHVRAFYRWMHNGELPREIALAVPSFAADRKSSIRVITTEERDSLLFACLNRYKSAPQERQRALLMTLWDTGFRASEILSLRIKDVQPDGPDGAYLALPPQGETPLPLKTGPRTIYAVECVPALRTWIALHPHKHDPDAFVWCQATDPRAPINGPALADYLNDASRRAGLRHLNPHLFRHTRATRAAKDGWVEAKMRNYFGWSPDSDEPATYIHLANADLKEDVRKAAGCDPLGRRVEKDPARAMAEFAATMMDEMERRRTAAACPTPVLLSPTRASAGPLVGTSFSYSFE